MRAEYARLTAREAVDLYRVEKMKRTKKLRRRPARRAREIDWTEYLETHEHVMGAEPRADVFRERAN